MEELRIYLDLVDQLGDPFTVFERDWPEDWDPGTSTADVAGPSREESAPPVEGGRHLLTESLPAVAAREAGSYQEHPSEERTYPPDVGFPG